jgi:hypothetical protein
MLTVKIIARDNQDALRIVENLFGVHNVKEFSVNKEYNITDENVYHITLDIDSHD